MKESKDIKVEEPEWVSRILAIKDGQKKRKKEKSFMI
jgi:hypothetical protein